MSIWDVTTIDRARLAISGLSCEMVELFKKEVMPEGKFDKDDINLLSDLFKMELNYVCGNTDEQKCALEYFKLRNDIEEFTSDIKLGIREAKQKIIHNIIRLIPPPTHRITIEGGVLCTSISGRCVISGVHNHYMLLDDGESAREIEVPLRDCSIDDLIYLGETIESGDYEVEEYTKGE